MRFFYLLLVVPFVFLFGAEGLEYTYVEIPNSSSFSYVTGSQSVHVIEVDPFYYEVKPVKALDDGIGRESVLSLSTRHGAVAAINGGFFSIGGTFDGKACGALKISDWYALPLKPRGCIGWSSMEQTPKMDRLWVKMTASHKFGHFPIDGLNRPRKNGEVILFSPCFHRTTLTNPDGQEIVIVNGIIQSIINNGNSKIPENGYVLSIQEANPLINTFEAGMSLNVSVQIIPLIDNSTSSDWESFDYIVGGTPLLLHHHKKMTDFIPEQTRPTFLSNRHARTAVGLL
ncbi:MAG: hypothetical protein ACRDFB_10615, partial [Rhabdochlamydiaceae bacterium]